MVMSAHSDRHGLIKVRDTRWPSFFFLFFVVGGIKIVPFAIIDGARSHFSILRITGREGK